MRREREWLITLRRWGNGQPTAALCHACQHRSGELKSPIQAYLTAVNVADNAGYMPLHHAVLAGRIGLKVLALLLKHRADASTRGPHGLLPLHLAVKRFVPSVEDMLLEAYVLGIGVADNSGMLPLHHLVIMWSRGKGISGVELWYALNFSGLQVCPKAAVPFNNESTFPDSCVVNPADVVGLLPLHWMVYVYSEMGGLTNKHSKHFIIEWSRSSDGARSATQVC